MLGTILPRLSARMEIGWLSRLAEMVTGILYLLDLASGGILRLTDTPEYDAAPSWSPDGAYIAYESYMNGNLDIFLHSVTNPRQAPIQLTQNPAADTSPAWSPLAGRSDRFHLEPLW